MMSHILLQIPDIFSALAQQGITFLLLGIAVAVLWRRDANMAEDRKKAILELQLKIEVTSGKLEKYLSEDRAAMLTCIQNNTQAFEDLKDVLDSLKNK